MGIDNIQLPGHLCQTMFTKCLTADKEPFQTPNKTAQKARIGSLGENAGNILFLVNNARHKFLADDEMKLLSDLLTACKVSMMDIALVNYAQHTTISYSELIDHFQSNKILTFGVTAADLELPFTIPHFQIQKFQEQLYMMAPSLEDFINNKELKKELWNSLKKIFLL